MNYLKCFYICLWLFVLGVSKGLVKGLFVIKLIRDIGNWFFKVVDG